MYGALEKKKKMCPLVFLKRNVSRVNKSVGIKISIFTIR
jgi:hypothetical protein